MDVDELIEALIEREGGYSNHPSDRGGPTKYGITEAVARAHGFSGAMRNLPRDEAAAITAGSTGSARASTRLRRGRRG